MKAECETNDHDDKDNGDGKEGVDDVLEEDDVFPDSVQEPHVEEQVDPAEGDGDGTGLPVQAGTLSPKEIVASYKESESVNERVKEEDSWEIGSPPLECLQLAPDRTVLLVCKKENDPRDIEHKKDVPEVFIEVGKLVSSRLIGRFIKISSSAVEHLWLVQW